MPKFKIRSKLYEPTKHGISQSLLEEYRRCQVKMRYITDGYYLPTESESIIYGSAWHYALEEVYTAIANGDVSDDNTLSRYLALRGPELLKRLREEYNTATTHVKEIVENQINKVLIILPWYFRYYKDEYSVKWAGLEKVFKFDIAGMHFKGKRDGDLIKPDNTLWLFETKTKSRYNTDTIMKWISMQLQVNSYLWSLYVDYKKRPSGVIYNIIRNPTIKKTARKSLEMYKEELSVDIQIRPEFYFQRLPRSINFQRVEAYYEKLTGELINFQLWCNRDRKYDMPSGASCEGKYGQCIFLNACASGGNDLSMLEKRENLFPEI